MQARESTGSSQRYRSLRIFALTMLLVCSFAAGWLVNSIQTRRNIDRVLLSKYSQLNAPANITVDEDLGIVTIKGAKEDVVKSKEIIEELNRELKK